MLSVSLALVSAAVALAPQTVGDDFDRPASTNLGPDWTEYIGDSEIESGGYCATNGFTEAAMYHNGISGAYGDAVISLGTWNSQNGFEYSSIIVGLNTATQDCLDIQLVDADLSGTWDQIKIYRGINGNYNGSWHPPIATRQIQGNPYGGTLTAVFSNSGTSLTLVLTDATGVRAVHQFGNLPIPTGDKFGVGVGANIDSYSVTLGSAPPVFPALSTNGVCGQVGSELNLTGMTSGGAIALFWSSSLGTSPVSTSGLVCPGVTLGLSMPSLAQVGVADPAGSRTMTGPGWKIPALLCGVAFVQVLDIASCAVSPPLAL